MEGWDGKDEKKSRNRGMEWEGCEEERENRDGKERMRRRAGI